MEELKEMDPSKEESDESKGGEFKKSEFSIFVDKVSDDIDEFYVKSDAAFQKLRKIINKAFKNIRSFFKVQKKEKEGEKEKGKFREKLYQQNLKLEKKLKKISKRIKMTNALAGEIKDDTSRIVLQLDEVAIILDHQMEAIGKIEEIESYMKANLGSDWNQVKNSWQEYKDGEISRGDFAKIALKKVGKKFLGIFVNTS
ncbi:hypothetical protein LCGC14_2077280 [marine sediment metagenome]|uniref:Uncharacterized protein n=2 Tax=marine sediment metagenome TaxID=412755 RepID=A0A0F9F400_9ZZZZ